LAENKLGWMYLEDFGGLWNHAQAFDWLQKPAAQEEALAQAAAAQQQAAQAQAQAPAAQKAQSSGSGTSAGGAVPHSQRPPMQVQIAGSQAHDPRSIGEACSNTAAGVPAGGETLWEEDFNYSSRPNQPARVNVTLTLTNGHILHRQVTIPLGGNGSDTFTVQAGCDIYSLSKIEISNIHVDASAL
jgi:hypothetical protein